MKISEQQLRQLFPQVPWDSPIVLTGASGQRTEYGCRICIAQHGLKEEEIDQHPKNAPDFAVHLLNVHGVGPAF